MKCIRFYPIVLTFIGAIIHAFGLFGFSFNGVPIWLELTMLIIDCVVVVGLWYKFAWDLDWQLCCIFNKSFVSLFGLMSRTTAGKLRFLFLV